MGGQSREGGKKKPLRTGPKVTKELDDDDMAFAEKARNDKKAEQAMRDKIVGKKGPLNSGGQGMKKSGKR